MEEIRFALWLLIYTLLAGKRTRQDPLRVPKNFGLFVYMYVRLLVTVLLFFLNSCHFYKRINSQTVGSWSLKPDNLLKWEPSTPEILWWVLLKSSAFGFLFVVLTFLVGNGESGSRVCAEVKGVQYKVTSLTTTVLSFFMFLSFLWLFIHGALTLWLQDESHTYCSRSYKQHSSLIRRSLFEVCSIHIFYTWML